MENASATMISCGKTDWRLREVKSFGKKRSSLKVGIIILIGRVIRGNNNKVRFYCQKSGKIKYARKDSKYT